MRKLPKPIAVPGGYRIYHELEREHGKRRRKPIDAPTARACVEKYLAYLAGERAGTARAARGETVADYLATWMDRRDPFTKNVGTKKVRYSKWVADESRIRLHVVPAIVDGRTGRLGDVALRDLTVAHVRTLIEFLSEKPSLSQTTVGICRALLVTALNQAIKDQTHGLTVNVAALTDPVRPSTPDVDAFYVLNEKQADAFLRAAAGDPFEALYELALHLGPRQGEVFGLKWDALELDADPPQMTIKRSLTRVLARDIEKAKRNGVLKAAPIGGLMTFAPKSKASAAAIPLTRTAVKLLRAHYRRELEKMVACGPVWQGGDPRKQQGFVFTTEIGTPISASNFMRRHFYPLCERAGIPTREQEDGTLGFRFHDMRHSALSIMAARGERPEVIQRIARHAHAWFTMQRYVKVFAPDLLAAVNRQDTRQTMAR